MAPRIRPWHIGTGLAALIAAITACSAAQQPAAQPAAGGAAAQAGAIAGDAARGKQVFASTCSACHGADARGLPGLGKNLVNPSEWMKKQTDASLAEMIKKGRPASDPENTTKVDMPPKGGNPALTDQDIADVVAYIRSLQKK